MKEGQSVLPGQVRAEMTGLAIQNKHSYRLSNMEIERQGNTYTYETLERLKEEQPETDFYFILGADSLFNLDKWAKPERIFANCHILAAVRDDATIEQMEEHVRMLQQRYGASIFLLRTGYLDISSSDIRRKVALGENITEDVPEQVAEYIKVHHLYQKQ